MRASLILDAISCKAASLTDPILTIGSPIAGAIAASNIIAAKNALLTFMPILRRLANLPARHQIEGNAQFFEAASVIGFSDFYFSESELHYSSSLGESLD